MKVFIRDLPVIHSFSQILPYLRSPAQLEERGFWSTLGEGKLGKRDQVEGGMPLAEMVEA